MKKAITILVLTTVLNIQAQLRLVKDLNTTTASSSSNPLSLYNVNGMLLFTANNSDTSTNRYMYYSFGTLEGTNFLLNDGQAIRNQNTTMYYRENGDSAVYFDGIDPNTSHISLMTASNFLDVYTLMDIFSKTANANSRFGPSAQLTNAMVFSPLAGQDVEPLVYSSGFSGMLKDIYMGNVVSSAPASFTVLGSKIYFSAFHPSSARELWSTDGTTANTALYLDIFPTPTSSSSNPDQFNVIGNTLYLVATNASSGRELRSVNGVNNSVVLVKDINPSGDSNPSNMKRIGATLYFSANDGINGAELWKSDGTNAGTVLVKNLNTTAGVGSNPSDFTPVGSLIYFLADNTGGGKQLWKTDGTTAGTTLVTTVSTAQETLSDLIAYNGKLYYVKTSNVATKSLWVSNGTAGGTTQLLSGEINNSGLVVMNDELYFGYKGTTGGFELHAYKDPALANFSFEASAGFVLVPNPAQDYFELTRNNLVKTVSVFNLQGQLVVTYDQQTKYDISVLARGNYLVKVVTSSGSSYLKLIKQ
ncbi:T9SS type A sorting domain-containing protein [Flavobacterium sp. CYK-4]|uniref:ELWxxDGT repeat protein n=1 Tax=Flavobacterium lotistagni TaxID=2709660 RepID=UPI00140D6172|nr:ELWxxDGT repeat protein [Flavobacterium lotistagni]NHM08167.1 T9SS type A sorting domain-containing protein [Flavobacterium lotistagni]